MTANNNSAPNANESKSQPGYNGNYDIQYECFQVIEKEDKETDGEESRLGSRLPLITLLILSSGPLISQILTSLFGVFNSLWVTKTIGDIGLEVFGAIFIVDYIQIGFAQYLMISVNIRISYLYGKQMGPKCSQLYMDFIRLAFFFGIMTASIVIPLTKPLTEWLGADSFLSQQCLTYMIPSSCLSCLNYFYMIGCGVLQAEGHSFIFCIAQVSTFILNICVFDPILLLVLKLPIWGAPLATAISQLIVGVTINVFIMRGKFSFKPKMKMLISKFSRETGKALLVGIPELVMELSLSVPLILMQKYLDNAAKLTGAFEEVTESWALTQRLYTFVEALLLGFVFGMLPAASYAYGAKRYNRLMKLSLHMLWISTLTSSIAAYLIIIFIRPVCSIWLDDPKFLDVAEKMAPVIFYAMPLIGLAYMAPALLESMQKALSATVLSLLSLLLAPIVASTALHFTKSDDYNRIMLTYPISDAVGFLLYIVFLIKPLKKLWEAPKDYLEIDQNPLIIKSDGGVKGNSVQLYTM